MRPVAAACTALCLGGATARAQVPVRVQVVSELGAAPLGYSVVALPEQALERFTSAAGVVVLEVAGTGRTRFVVKRLGFVPKDTVIDVTGPGQQITVALERLSLQLEPVRVVAWPRCVRPGIPRRGGDERVRRVVEQLRQNGERYRLVTTQHPFSYEIEREFSRVELGRGAPSEQIERRDTITVNGRPDWRYEPGRMVSRDTRRGPGEWMMHLPVLSDLAEQAFIDNHCFHVAGLEDKEGRQLLRLDIVAAARLRGPDVNATVWLDPHELQMRYAEFVLTPIPEQFRDLLYVSSKVTYVEVAPYIPVMHETATENLAVRGITGASTVSFRERQRILRLTFHGTRPGTTPPDGT